ncbi:hypothetical protein JRO89_XS13G0135000 [Xanthoceras sorbifolium]|uniref:Cellulose synthase-like protein G3 n=1 Tax=Xanthoceras sorbifolium TaxID=99658 RepID=A0ABQ8H875_9ROSI|nr:hypothetical protein JRO89_XS13G0135000 [Xanthoceras sorbifolium]
MGSLRRCTTSTTTTPLNTVEPLRRTVPNRVFAAVYTCAIFALLYHHAQTLLLHSKTLVCFSMSLSLLLADIVLAFMWATTQSFRMRPVHRSEHPENLEKVTKRSEFPGLDVFICTADPYKEPPMGAVNTALSVMAYDYPTEKLSVYLSDDGGSVLTLFAFMEAAKFASHWLPFCRKNDVVERNPHAYFASNHSRSSETENIKMMYESMKVRVEHVLEMGKVSDEYITSDQERKVFDKWTDGFTRQDHPTVIQVLLESSKDKDITGNYLPNLIYVTREKSKTSHHYFKAGALNVLLRVSATMSNAPIVLTLDCDMYSNDPQTPLRVLCYVFDPEIRPTLAFVQFPQRFGGLNKNDIYASEFKRLFEINPIGFDGLRGSNYVGTGAFFCRRALFGNPSTFVSPEIPELSPNHAVKEPINSLSILSLAHHVAACNYENQTNWGSKMGFRYGSLVEDYYTGYRLHCEGWRSVFCHPMRPAFYGDAPTNLLDMLNQQKRWAIGLLEVAFSKYSPITFGIRSLGLMSLGYAHLAFWASYSIPISVYGFLPQLALLNGISIFPKVSEPWFFLYSFLFVGAYVQDFLDFVLEGGTFGKWWNDQRIWMIKGLSSYLFGVTEYLLKSLGISAAGFNVTSKVVDDELSKRYDQEIFEFGLPSPIFVPIIMAAILNFFSFLWGFLQIIRGVGDMQGLFLQMFLSGFVTVNCWPIYEAIVLRSDKGKMHAKVTIIAALLAWALYTATSLIFK